MKDLKCKHIDMKKYKDKSIYCYNICKGQDVVLCEDCHMILASEVMKQLAIEVFVHSPVICDCKICKEEERRETEEIFSKIKGGKKCQKKTKTKKKEMKTRKPKQKATQ
jgi:hypothetical protein